MKIFKYSRTSLIWLSVLILLIIFLLLPIKIPYSIKSPGKILPSKEWIVSKGPDGRLITILKDNKLGVSQNYSVSQFERGDAIQFSLQPNISSGTPINKMDTVGLIYSNEIERQFVQLKGDLETAKSSLITYTTGEKQSIIKEERERLEYMKKQAEEQKKVFNRVETLFQKNLISQEEYEISKGTADLNNINIAIAQAHLQTIETGEKKEQVDLIKSQIQSLQKQLDVLQKRFKNYTLISQVTGVANRSLGVDTLLVVSDTTEFVIVIPVRWEDRNYLSLNQKILLKFPDTSVITDAVLVKIDHSIHALNGGQVFLITAKLNQKPLDVLPGLMIQCSIQCEPVRPIQYLTRMFSSVWN
jgi:hypothetical protein